MSLVKLAVEFADAWIMHAPSCDPLSGRAALRKGLASVREGDADVYERFVGLEERDRRRLVMFASMLVRAVDTGD